MSSLFGSIYTSISMQIKMSHRSKFIALSIFLTLALSMTSASIDHTGCPIQFEERCKCGMSKYPNSPERPDAPKKFVVNCTNTGFKKSNMLKFLPNQTQILIFTGNQLGELPLNILGTTDYDDLELIDMSNNKITFIPGKAFHHVYNVRTLILNHNDIEISSRSRPRMFYNFDSLENLHLTNAFTEAVNSSFYLLNLEDIFYESDLGLLVKIHLEQNEIYTIGKNASIFCQLPALKHLYLGDNRLSDLDFNLQCMPDIEYIDLQRNSINQLSVDALDKLDNFTKSFKLTLEIQENPFMCDCYSSRFIKWLKHTKVILRDLDKYRCADGIPRSNVGKSLDHINVIELECPTDIESFVSSVSKDVEGYSASTIGTLAFLLAFVTAMLLAIAYYHRIKIKETTRPYWEHITRKVGYSGLVNEETKVVAV